MKRHLEELPAPEPWKQRVREELELRGMTQLDLAKRVGSAKSAISQLLSPKLQQPTSRLVVAISEALQIELPAQARLILAAKNIRAGEENEPHLLRLAKALEAQAELASAVKQAEDAARVAAAALAEATDGSHSGTGENDPE